MPTRPAEENQKRKIIILAKIRVRDKCELSAVALGSFVRCETSIIKILVPINLPIRGSKRSVGILSVELQGKSTEQYPGGSAVSVREQ